MKQRYTYLLIYLFCLAVGFFLGRSTVDKQERVGYVKGEIVYQAIPLPLLYPVREERPERPLYPVKHDTIWRDSIRREIAYIHQKVDTAAIIADYILNRSYDILAFDNKEHGTLRLYPKVQYNKLSAMDYSFTPVYKQVTKTKEKVWQPFLSGSYSTLDFVGIGGGLFYHNMGFEYQYQKDIHGGEHAHSFGVKYKF